MTEREWEACTDPGPMLRFLQHAWGLARRKEGRRGLWLFACGCYRRFWPLMTDLRCRLDALEDAGAAGPLLDHLRGPGLHVRGCAGLDAALGRR